MTKVLDLTGKKFGRLTVVSRAQNNKHGQSMWNCVCKCINKITVNGRDLKNGHTKSCGCLKSPSIFKRLNENIDKSSGRWIWTGYKIRGYGRIHYKRKLASVHRLIYELFIGEIHTGLYVCHKNDIPWDVTPSNLFLGTPKENSNDMTNKGRQVKGSAVHTSKLKEEDVFKIKELLESGYSISIIAKKYNINQSSIHAIKARKSWKHI